MNIRIFIESFALPQARAAVSCNVLVLDDVMGGMDAITISNTSIGISSSIGGVIVSSYALVRNPKKCPREGGLSSLCG